MALLTLPPAILSSCSSYRHAPRELSDRPSRMAKSATCLPVICLPASRNQVKRLAVRKSEIDRGLVHDCSEHSHAAEEVHAILNPNAHRVRAVDELALVQASD